MVTKIIVTFIIGLYLLMSSSIVISAKINNGGVKSIGASSVFNTTRLLKKSLTTKNNFQYQVTIYKNNTFHCGAVILSESYVITSAHCVTGRLLGYPYPTNILQVRGGPSHEIQIFNITKIVVHKSYNKRISPDYNIAVLKLATHLPLNQGFKTIELTKRSVADDTKCIVTGWVQDEENATLVHLHYAYVNKVNRKHCTDLYYHDKITPRMICFEYKGLPTESCLQDSGGALVCKHKLVGIYSWDSEECARQDLPAVYSNIANLRAWILATSEDDA